MNVLRKDGLKEKYGVQEWRCSKPSVLEMSGVERGDIRPSCSALQLIREKAVVSWVPMMMETNRT